MEYVFKTPVQTGDHLYARYDTGLEELTITEVGSRGCFVSNFAPPEDDFGDYIEYDRIGVEWFLTREAALAAYNE